MKTALFWILGSFLLVAVAWHVFEYLWDRRIFHEDTDSHGLTKNLSARQAEALLEAEPDLQVLDVRSRTEAMRGGQIAGALRISYGDPDFEQRVRESFDPNQPILTYCAGGFRGRLVVPRLEELGFQRIYHIHRGMIQWRLAGKEIEAVEE